MCIYLKASPKWSSTDLSRAPPDDSLKDDAISIREREILQLLAEGKSNKDISEILNLSIKTVETHRNNIMHKLGIKNVVGLVLYAVRNHIIDP